MQHDKYTDFDLELRSMLQDAEEEVPSRVWDALSEELDRREKRKVVTLRWRRAVAGICAAAAAVAGVVIFSGRGAEENGIQTVPSAYVAENEGAKTESQEPATIEEQIASTNISILADVPEQKTVETKNIVTIPDQVEEPSEVETAPVESVEESSAVKPAEKEKPATNIDKEEDWVDPFDIMEYEDAHSKSSHKGFSLSVDGNAATNDRSSEGLLPSKAASNASGEGIYEKSTSTFGVPLSFGIGAKYNFTDRLAIGTGITYSLLSRSFTGIYNSADGKVSVNSDIYNEIHYLGVPLNLYWDIIMRPDMKFYAWGGGSVEKGLVNRYRIYNKPDNIIYKKSVDGVQLSTAVGLGLEFSITDLIGLYVDPSVRYYFDCNQPTSVRTMKPFMMNFEVGLRFDLR